MIPEDEQPYKIPDNWRWVRLTNLSEIISKGTTPKGGRKIYSEQGINFLRVENLNDDGTISHDNIEHISEEIHYNYLKRSILKDGDILISIAGTLGKTGLVRKCDLPLNINQAICFIRLLDGTDENYIKYCFDNPDIKNSLLLQTRTTAIPNLTLKIIGNILIPLPPLDEQKKIVEIIERLFEKLDKARAFAQKIVDNYELRRSIILHKAFNGELTNSNLDDWRKTNLGDLCNFIGGGTPSKKVADYWNGNIHWASVKDVKSDYLYYTIDKITEAGLKNSSANLCEIDDLILVTRMAPGKTIIAKIVTAINQDLKIVKSDLCIKFLHYFFKNIREKIEIKSRGTTVNGIKIETLNEFEIFVPSIEEQKEIVRILDNLLSKEQRTKEIAEQTLQKIDLLKKIILARAFRGEL